MAWTSPRTWAVSEFVTAAFMNTHVRDNLLFLKSSPVIAEVTSTTVVATDGSGPLTVLTTGAVAIPADVGAVYCEAWANTAGFEAAGGTYWWQVRIQEPTAGVLRVAGVNSDINQRYTTANNEFRAPLYMRTTELLWAGTTRTVNLNMEAAGCFARITATSTSPITLRIVRAY